MKVALILEDMPESQEMLREVAQTAFLGIRVCCAADIASALNLLQKFEFDLALIDLSLPDGDGTKVIEAMAARFPNSVIVVATIFDDDAHLFPALRAGAHGYLLKDQPPEQLVNQLHGISVGHPALSPAIARRLLNHFRVDSGLGSVEVAAEISLTGREREVLVQLAHGVSISEIGALIGISRHTVSDHVKKIYRKLNISSRAEAALQARNMGLA
jgi:DNA-binding NarL/FixJ family response regulator